MKCFLIILSFLLSIFAIASTSSNIPLIEVTVTDRGDGEYDVVYSFDTPQNALIFTRSNADYRREHWKPIEEGVSIDRLAGLDALLFESPRTEAKFRIQPYFKQIPSDYSHFIKFSDGGRAMFTGQFEVMSAKSEEEVRMLEADLNKYQGIQPELVVKVCSSSRMVLQGEVVKEDAVHRSIGGGAFVYMGDGQIEEGENYIGIFDSDLPEWLRQGFDDDLGVILNSLESAWGFELEQRTTLLFAFEGYDNPGFSNKGGALGSQLIIQSSGAQLEHENPLIRNYLLWFFSHEAAHLFQYAKGPLLGDTSDSWIHEGAANTMAHRLMAERAPNPSKYLNKKYSVSFADCIRALTLGSLITAPSRGDFQACYSCGDFIGLITEAALDGVDIFEFWNALLERASETDDRTYDRNTYFDTMIALGADVDAVFVLREFVEGTHESPEKVLSELLIRFGLQPKFDDEWKLVGIDVDGV